MKSIITTLAALLFTLSLAGCGQSGPLYIPGDPSSIETPQKPPQTEEESDDNGDNDEDTDSQ